MKQRKNHSLRISDERKKMLEMVAIEVSYATGKAHKWTDVAFYLIDNYTKYAEKRMKKKAVTAG